MKTLVVGLILVLVIVLVLLGAYAFGWVGTAHADKADRWPPLRRDCYCVTPWGAYWHPCTLSCPAVR